MSTDTAPRDYVVGAYVDYQRAYAEEPRESDRVLIGIIRNLLGERSGGASLLDVGCCNGNLLRHLRRAMPGLRLSGSDVFPELMDTCRADPELAGMDFRVMDLRDLPDGPAHDVVTVNAVLHRFEREQFAECVRGLSRLVAPGGALVVFDWFHPFEQELVMREYTPEHPDGLSLVTRPFSQTRGILEAAGFGEVAFRPFHMPFDLARPADDRNVTYTVPSPEGRLSVRGSLLQPWCHVVARRLG